MIGDRRFVVHQESLGKIQALLVRGKEVAMDDSMDDTWDAVKTSVATAPLGEALAIIIHELRIGLVQARGALHMMQHTQREADQVRYREVAHTGIKRTNQVINELLVDIIGQQFKRE